MDREDEYSANCAGKDRLLRGKQVRGTPGEERVMGCLKGETTAITTLL